MRNQWQLAYTAHPAGRLHRPLQSVPPLRRAAAWCLCLLVLVTVGSRVASAGSSTTVTLASDFDMQVQQYPAGGRALLIWVPSEHGIRDGNEAFARAIQRAGVDYWLVDLHESYLAPTGRNFYTEFEPRHLKELIDRAVDQGWRDIVLGGESRGGALAMQAARQWQLAHPGHPALKGLLLFHPYLLDGRTEIGEQAQFQPIARATNLPVYLLQPQLNTKSLHSEGLMAELQSGGAAVYFHPLQGVRGGFHVRDPVRLTPRESEERARAGQHVRRAVDLLVRLPPPARAVSQPDPPGPRPTRRIDTDRMLVPLGGDAAPPLRLHDDEDRLLDLHGRDGEVVLVNFWASWCGACVKEIASLMRLVERFDGRPFRMMAINIGETRTRVAEFFEIRDIQPNFQVLYDRDGAVAKAWRVYAVPSTYLLDKQHRLRYGYRGALKWDKPSVVETVRELLE